VSETLLEARGLAVARAGVPVVQDVDLTLRRGDVVAVLGPNGAGKSTLLAALAGLLPSSHGTLARHGRVAAALQAPALANRSARANVEAALAWWGVPRRERRQRAADALGALAVSHLADRPAGSLSGGEARRVHLARAIAVRPDVLLLDEPFAGLDAPTRADLLDDATAALADPRRATVIVVHDRAEAWALARTVVVLLGGRARASGPVGDVLERPPGPDVAAFLGFSGTLHEADGAVRKLKPAHVVLDPDGELTATVTRRIPVEDGARLELSLVNGRLHANTTVAGPQVGDRVRIRIDGGVVYPAER
jgi:ABC-type nitrate/sulfonate/bicarbonate transport system ATPase subunit